MVIKTIAGLTVISVCAAGIASMAATLWVLRKVVGK